MLWCRATLRVLLIGILPYRAIAEIIHLSNTFLMEETKDTMTSYSKTVVDETTQQYRNLIAIFQCVCCRIRRVFRIGLSNQGIRGKTSRWIFNSHSISFREVSGEAFCLPRINICVEYLVFPIVTGRMKNIKIAIYDRWLPTCIAVYNGKFERFTYFNSGKFSHGGTDPRTIIRLSDLPHPIGSVGGMLLGVG